MTYGRRSDGNFHRNLKSPANIHTNLISPETRFGTEYFSADSMGLPLLVFYPIVFEIHRKNCRRTCAKTEFNVKRYPS